MNNSPTYVIQESIHRSIKNPELDRLHIAKEHLLRHNQPISLNKDELDDVVIDLVSKGYGNTQLLLEILQNR